MPLLTFAAAGALEQILHACAARRWGIDIAQEHEGWVVEVYDPEDIGDRLVRVIAQHPSSALSLAWSEVQDVCRTLASPGGDTALMAHTVDPDAVA